jgi:hypothetical protein
MGKPNYPVSVPHVFVLTELAWRISAVAWLDGSGGLEALGCRCPAKAEQATTRCPPRPPGPLVCANVCTAAPFLFVMGRAHSSSTRTMQDWDCSDDKLGQHGAQGGLLLESDPRALGQTDVSTLDGTLVGEPPERLEDARV